MQARQMTHSMIASADSCSHETLKKGNCEDCMIKLTLIAIPCACVQNIGKSFCIRMMQ